MHHVRENVALEISKTPGVCGGDACIGQTRIPVWLLINYRKQGASEDKLIELYPQLTKQHLQLAWAYYEKHAEEIERSIREQDEEVIRVNLPG